MTPEKKSTKGSGEKDKGTHRSSSPKVRSSGGKVEKTKVTKSASDRKLESQKLRLAAKEIRSDPQHPIKNKNTSKEKKQAVKDEKSPNVVKAEKTEDVALYKQKMRVTRDPERKCTENELEKIKEALVDALKPLEDGCFPQFYSTHNCKGALVLTCANEQTKLWLEKTVPKLKPWKGAKLCVKPKGEVPQGPKVLLKTPKLFAKTDSRKILQMLSTQNKTLETNTWKYVSAKSEASGQTLIYAIDDRSLEAIRALNNKAYLGLGNVELVILNSEEDGKQTSVDTGKKNEEDDKHTSLDADMKSEEEDDKKTSGDTDKKNGEEGDKQTSGDTDMKNGEEGDKQMSGDTDTKNREEGDKQTSVDTEMKTEEEDDNQTS